VRGKGNERGIRPGPPGTPKGGGGTPVGRIDVSFPPRLCVQAARMLWRREEGAYLRGRETVAGS
jgi:hypothetical protein